VAASNQPIAIGYARVSTEGQAHDGVSLDAQRAKIEAWCLSNGYKLGGLYVDALSGGRADNRPQLQKALDAVCERPNRKSSRNELPGRVLIVYSLSRLARSVRDTIQIADRLEKANADLVSLSEKIDTTSAAGRMVFRMLAVLAEFERDLISERTSAALQYLRSQGKRVGSVPYGFELTEDPTRLREVPAEQQVIASIVSMRESGSTFRAIAAELMDKRVPAKESRRWHPRLVMMILRRHGAARRCNAEAKIVAAMGQTGKSRECRA
jgi:site-specific DNA recombinase